MRLTIIFLVLISLFSCEDKEEPAKRKSAQEQYSEIKTKKNPYQLAAEYLDYSGFRDTLLPPHIKIVFHPLYNYTLKDESKGTFLTRDQTKKDWHLAYMSSQLDYATIRLDSVVYFEKWENHFFGINPDKENLLCLVDTAHLKYIYFTIRADSILNEINTKKYLAEKKITDSINNLKSKVTLNDFR